MYGMKIGLFPFSFFLFIPLFPFARHGYILYTLARKGGRGKWKIGQRLISGGASA